jgi:hypothetical protein
MQTQSTRHQAGDICRTNPRRTALIAGASVLLVAAAVCGSAAHAAPLPAASNPHGTSSLAATAVPHGACADA